MTTLPEGWEFDYDGTRWLYRYKANGHVQFHFPTEGDEFPDFVAPDAPPADLAPEEKLVSQQQVKRKTSPGGNDQKPGIKTGMRATAGPMGAMEPFDKHDDDDDDQDDGGFYYQPESFMFLGPGSYQDISPLGEEEGERQKGQTKGDEDRVGDSTEKKDKGTIRDGQTDVMDRQDAGDKSKVSPIHSEATTPSVTSREIVKAAEVAPRSSQPGPVVTAEIQNLPEQDGASATAPSAVVHLVDSREMPHELPAESPRYPIGTVFEMPTEQTPLSRSETHPEPVEMGDHSILAPIETGMAILEVGIAELPEQTSPVERREPNPGNDELQQTSLSEEDLQKATFGTQSRPSSNRNTSQVPSQAKSDPLPLESQRIATQASEEKQEARSSIARNESPAKITRKLPAGTNPSANVNPQGGAYRPFVPGAAGPAPGITEAAAHAHRSMLQEPSMISARAPSEFDRQSILPARQPSQLRRKKPNDAPSSTSGHVPQTNQTEEPNPLPEAHPGQASHETATQSSLTHVPSVLKPARGRIPEPAQASRHHLERQTHRQQARFIAPPRPYYDPSRRQLQRKDPRRASGPGEPPARAKTDLPSRPQTFISSQSGRPPLEPRSGVERVYTEPVQQPPVTLPPGHVNSSHNPVTSHAEDRQPRPVQPQRSNTAQSAFSVTSQESFAVSDVSSLGPPSSGTSSSRPLETPSPLESPADSSHPSGSANPNTTSGDSAHRRYSMPTEYFTNRSQHQQLAIPTRPDSGQHSRQAYGAHGQEGGQLPREYAEQYNETPAQGAAASGRPRQPVVIPPTQQTRRASISTPTATAGHVLHPIQEHPEGDYVPRLPHHGPSNLLPRSSLDVSRSGQRERATTVPPNLQQQYPSEEGGPGAPRVGMQIQVPMHPQEGPSAEKEKKEKGRWFSKLKKYPNKPGVLQKQPRTGMQQPAASTWSQQPQHPQQSPHPQQPQHLQQSQPPQQPYPIPFPVQASRRQRNPAPQPPTPADAWVNGAPSRAVHPGAPQMPTPQSGGPTHPVTDPPLHHRSSSTSGPGINSDKPNGMQAGFPKAESPATFNASQLDRQASTASYASSVMTVDISEARAQPILRPQLVTVYRAGPAPSPATATAPAGPPSTASSAAPQGPRASMDGYITGAPVFSSQEPQNAEATQKENLRSRPRSNQWAKRPAADYSGDDWGGDGWVEYR
ncbi:hypothetical protein ACRALDRAFT_1082506 [Sodiomyces alcalophilus JCM 7366]|uniref:uncharacterized protein n=1 Tax=Sodiomyces alcalophilus JCM 7366 TaxID=591952 RepID=UPI0039B45A38